MSHPKPLTPAMKGAVFAVIIGFILIFNIPFVSGLVASWKDDKSGNFVWPDNPGVFGDSFGALTCLFSAASFWAVLYALLLQKKETAEAKNYLRRKVIDDEMKKLVETLPFFTGTLKVSPSKCSLIFGNVGNKVYNVTLTFDGDWQSFSNSKSYVGEAGFVMSFPPLTKTVKFNVSYTTAFGRELTESMEFSPDGKDEQKCFSNRKSILHTLREEISRSQ